MNENLKSRQLAPPWFGTRVAIAYGLFFFFIGIYLPFFPVWLEARGLTPTQIGIVLAIPMLIRVVTSGAIASFADRQSDRAKVVSWLYWGSLLSATLYLISGGFWAIALLTLIVHFFWNPIMPLLDAITLSGVRRFDVDYGRVRLLGSITFIIANFTGGWLLGAGRADMILYSLLVFLFLGASWSLAIPRIGRAPSAAGGRKTDQKTSSLYKNQAFMSVMISAGCLQASHAVLYSFGSLYWQSIGYSGTLIGALWAIGVVAEIILFQFSRPLISLVTPRTLLMIGGIGAIVRWSVFTLEPGVGVYFFLQALHGLSFGATHIATMYFILNSVEEENIGAAQGVGFVLGGAIMGGAVLASGIAYDAFGLDAYWFMAGLSALALVALRFSREGVQKAP